MRLPSYPHLLLSSAVALVLFSATASCGPSVPPLPVEPDRCVGLTPRDVDAGVDGAMPRAISLGAGEGASFVEWNDGATATVIMGFQGGAMITPTLRVPALPTEGETICLHVELHNTLSDGSTTPPGLVTDITFTRVGDVFEAANLFNQIGESADSLRGKTLTFVVEVRGVTFTASKTMSLLLG